MPIIAATCGAKLGVVKTLARMPTPASEMAMPMSAVRIGRPIAISEPNAMSSTMIAARMPTISLAGIAGFAEPAAGELDVDALRLRAAAARSLMSFAVSVGCVPEPLAVVIGATAILPPCEIRIGSTSMTPFTCATCARYASIAGRFCRDVGEDDLRLVTVRCGKSRSSVSYAACESVCGSRPLFA